jgi:hypothetical protein
MDLKNSIIKKVLAKLNPDKYAKKQMTDMDWQKMYELWKKKTDEYKSQLEFLNDALIDMAGGLDDPSEGAVKDLKKKIDLVEKNMKILEEEADDFTRRHSFKK